MKDSSGARRVTINGIVQGVGFRPFLFKLASKYNLSGEVSNTSRGVIVTIQGKPDKIDLFIKSIKTEKPVLALISSIESCHVPISGYKSFKIKESKPSRVRSTLISPDVSICRECLDELNNPENRRFEYPFINCTNCGPRFTIIEDIPYDRPKTSMKHFPMCEECQKEYYNPLDRRFHAQPNACAVCGPGVTLVNSFKEEVCNSRDSITRAAELLKQGKILAVKGLGGYHLAVDACSDQAVKELRKRKSRPHKPFALMAESVDAVKRFVHVDKDEKKLLESFNRPVVLLKKKQNMAESLSASLAPVNRYLGIMLPYTPLHYILLKKGPDLLVMTSGNRSGEPLSIDNDDALAAFSHIADYFLIHNRDIYFRADDSIVQVKKGKTRFLRRSRGYAPLPVMLKNPCPEVLAAGGGLKSTVCLTKGSHGFLSQHIGDLFNFKTFTFYKNTIEHLKKIMDIRPGIIAHDMHPSYMSTDYAEKYAEKEPEIKLCAVQHHHAHAVSCMAENQIDHRVMALTLDGTGFGTDGEIWGGEIITCDYTSFTREAHLEYIPMPGSEAAVLEPWRMAVAYLNRAFGNDMFDLDINFLKRHEKEKIEFLQRMMRKKLNSPLTSSSGRLFDGISSILGIRDKISFESQAAMELEALADTDISHIKPYGFSFKNIREKGFEIGISPLIKGIVHDITDEKELSFISAKFHKTFVDMFVKGVLKVKETTALNDVVLSGGVFNNSLVFDNMVKELENNGLKVYTHTKVPAGDGGISLGQAVIAGAREKEQRKG